jgi:PAS domain S-box-containing protein
MELSMRKNSTIANALKTNRVILVGVLLGLLYWIMDAAILVIIFNQDDLATQLLRPELQIIWRRGIVIILLFVLSVYAQAFIKRRDKEEVLGDEEQRYRQLVELSPDAIGIQSEDRIIYMNRAGVELFGAQCAEDLVGKSVWSFVPDEFRETVMSRYQQMREGGTEAPLLEMKLLRLDGKSIDVEVTAIPFASDEKPSLHVVFRDLTKRKRVEKEIRQRNIELAALNAIASTVSQSLNLQKILNDALDDVLQLDVLGGGVHGMIFLQNELTGQLSLAAQRGTPKDHPCLESPPKLGECLCGLAIERGRVVISEDCWTDERHTRSWPGMPQHKDICVPLIVRGKVLGGINIRLPMGKEITENVTQLLASVGGQISVAVENARLFETVDRHRERLRVLGARLAEAEETERRQLSRELHDQVGQNLTALGINLNILRSQLPSQDAKRMSTTLDESMALVEQTAERIRDVMADLRPPMLDDYGLVATLRWFGEQFASRTGLSIEIIGEEPAPRLAPPAENALFRVATEALTNVAKHAGAGQVIVSVECTDEALRIIVADDGKGFDPHIETEPGEERGWGLITMLERIESVGGRFWVESSPFNGGTRVCAVVSR